MGKLAAVLVSFLVAGCTAFTLPPANDVTIEEPAVSAVDKALDATVALVDPERDNRVFCTGVFHRDVIVTAAHCVADAQAGMVAVSTRAFELPEGHFSTTFMYHAAYVDSVQDLAILRLEGSSAPDHTNLDIGDDPIYGQKAISIGHPLGLAYTITAGIVSYPRRVGEDGQVWTQAATNIYFGNSGGPLLNEYAEIIGIASFIARVPHLGGFCHVSQIRLALLKAGVN